MKNVLIINGHPDPNSFNHALASSYKNGLSKTDAIISQININELKFNPNLQYGYRQRSLVKVTYIASVKGSSAAFLKRWLEKVYRFSEIVR